ncbi:MAG: hypothetical protein H6707_02280 [Deltaproteobacteria bacterium]|nr:hypothetical protein [Deltaproteobacteria bacterium]
MPLLRVCVSSPIDPQLQQGLMSELSRRTAEILGKRENYMMVIVEHQPMLMGGTSDRSAYAEVRSVGEITARQAEQLAEALSSTVAPKLDIDPDRIYANFFGVNGAMWGWGGRTFG